jgi:hypothetical protein
MNNENQIRFVKRTDIDEEKWSRCIENAPNSRVYANYWYLDHISDSWDALVFGDYEFVMPLPNRRKYGFSYVYQPAFCQQLGIFPEPGSQIAWLFYEELYQRFSYSDIQLNAENQLAKTDSMHFAHRNNYVLTLNQTYNQLAAKFSTNTRRNISKAIKNKLQFVAGIQPDEYLQFNKANLNYAISEKELIMLKKLVAFGQFRGNGQICGVYSEKNELCAAVFFCRWKNRIIYLNAVSNSDGKENGGMFLLVDTIIRLNAESNTKLDFEGSMVLGVARFYAGFGATAEIYYQLRFNKLPWPLKLLKK